MLKFSPCQRKLHQLTNFSPPVNHYHPTLPSALPYIRFNQQPRFVEPQQSSVSSPGPTHYFNPKQTLPKIKQGTLFKHTTRQVSVVPSIPALSSNLYEDIGNGMIVSMRMPEKVVGGRKGGCVGVGEGRNNKNSNGKLVQKRILERIDQNIEQQQQPALTTCIQIHPITIPPQHHHPTHKSLHNESTKLQSDYSMDITLNPNPADLTKSQHTILESIVAEDVKSVGIERLEQLTRLLTKDSVPGPGLYEIKGMLGRVVGGGVGRVTEKRFRGLPWSKGNQNPGPGCYEIPQTNQPPVTKINQANRFPSNQPFQHIPGPGTYDHHLPFITHHPRRQSLDFQPGFGSGSKRFLDKFERQPGPGAYNLRKKYEKKKMRVVIEEVKKREEEEVVDAGIRLILTDQREGSEGKEENKGGFKKKKMTYAFTASPRFKETVSEGYLGPGYYDIKQARTKFNKKSNYFGKQIRC